MALLTVGVVVASMLITSAATGANGRVSAAPKSTKFGQLIGKKIASGELPTSDTSPFSAVTSVPANMTPVPGAIYTPLVTYSNTGNGIAFKGYPSHCQSPLRYWLS
jgi:hypothetical protein